jgi:hypothetical protein
MTHDLRQILHLIARSADAIDILLTHPVAGGVPHTLLDISDMIARLFRRSAEGAIILSPVLNQAASGGNASAKQGLRAYRLRQALQSAQARLIAINNVLEAKFAHDWGMPSTELISTGVAVMAHSAVIERLLAQAVSEGILSEAEAKVDLEAIEHVELDLPLSVMKEGASSQSYGASVAEVKAVIQAVQKSSRLVIAVERMIASAVEELGQLQKLAVAVLRPETEVGDREIYAHTLVEADAKLQSMAAMLALLEDALVQLGPIMEPVCADWDCPGLAMIVADLAQPPPDSLSASPVGHQAEPFRTAPVDSLLAARSMLIALLYEHEQLLCQQPIDSDARQSMLISRRVITSFEAIREALGTSRRLSGGMIRDQAEIAAAHPAFGPIAVTAVQLYLANKSATTVFAIHQDIGGWLMFLALQQSGRLPGQPVTPTPQSTALMLEMTAAHGQIAEAGAPFGWASLSESQEQTLVQISTVDPAATETARLQAASHFAATNTLIGSGAEVEAIYSSLIGIIKSAKLASLARFDAEELQGRLDAATTVLDAAATVLANLTSSFAQRLRHLGYHQLAAAAEAMF